MCTEDLNQRGGAPINFVENSSYDKIIKFSYGNLKQAKYVNLKFMWRLESFDPLSCPELHLVVIHMS